MCRVSRSPIGSQPRFSTIGSDLRDCFLLGRRRLLVGVVGSDFGFGSTNSDLVCFFSALTAFSTTIGFSLPFSSLKFCFVFSVAVRAAERAGLPVVDRRDRPVPDRRAFANSGVSSSWPRIRR